MSEASQKPEAIVDPLDPGTHPTRPAVVPVGAPAGVSMVADGAAPSFDREASHHAPASDEPGAIVDGKFRLLGPIGEGGMGTVLLARDLLLDREVALKLIRSDMLHSQELDSQFLREARCMASIRHENVVAIHAYGRHGRNHYIAMEYIPGVTLEHWLAQHQPVDIDVALGILRQVCAGVQAIHAAGAAHLDLKPANVLIGPAFRVAITDLGLARRLEEGFRNDLPRGGTPIYLAPELAYGPASGPDPLSRADIYSLGVLAFELLTGRPPFDSESVNKILYLHATAQPPTPSELRPDLPPAFDAPILKALAKTPADRPASAIELIDALQAARNHRPKPAAAPSILVADDDAVFCAIAKASLLRAFPGAEVRCASNGVSALDAVEAFRPQVVVLDLQMPELNGLEVIAAIRGEPLRTPPKIVVATGVGTTADWKLLAELDAEAFLVKPVAPAQLQRAIARILGLVEPPPA